MYKIVFFNIPAHGHTNPTLSVIRELVSRGHEVWYYSYNCMRKKIESTGAKFVSCDAFDAEKKMKEKDSSRVGKDLAFSTKLLVDTTLALDNKVSREIKRLKPDCIVADSMALWGKAVALKFGIPFVSSTTTFAFNRHSAKVMKQGAGDLLKMIFALPKTSAHIHRLQKKGYPVKTILDIIGSDDNTNTIVYTSPAFQPCSETFSDKYSFVGPLIRPSSTIVEKKRDKLIYISMGTVNTDMMAFYKMCISAFGNTDYQVIMSVGNLVDLNDFDKVPANIAVYPHVDQIAVLEKADVFLSHGGMNSVSESLYHEVPLVLFPQTTEQKGVATRVSELGAGLILKKINANSVLCAVKQILGENTYKVNAGKIAQGFKNALGAKGAADIIIKICQK